MSLLGSRDANEGLCRPLAEGIRRWLRGVRDVANGAYYHTGWLRGPLKTLAVEHMGASESLKRLLLAANFVAQRAQKVTRCTDQGLTQRCFARGWGKAGLLLLVP